ncbi:MAG TPA: hypothetical protein VE131_13695 [Terriglobales bacterium]|nr:hypothetical protein [Terriglobales bacterium]
MQAYHTPKVTVSAFIVAAAIATGATPASAVDGVISSTRGTVEAYCHLKFPAIRPSTLATPHPRLKSRGTGDVIDYYGSCNHDPLGKAEVVKQEREYEQSQTRDD